MPTKNDFLVQGQKCVQINKVENIITRIYANKYTCFIAKAAVILNWLSEIRRNSEENANYVSESKQRRNIKDNDSIMHVGDEQG